MAERDTGDATSLSKNPSWMSTAMFVPPIIVPNSTPCTMVVAIMKSRNESAPNPGSCVARFMAATLIAVIMSGNSIDGTHICGLRSVFRIDAADAAETILELATALNVHDARTRGHSERVSRVTEMIAREWGMREDRVQVIRIAGMLHDTKEDPTPLQREIDRVGRTLGVAVIVRTSTRTFRTALAS